MQNALTYPPHGIRDELEASCFVKLLGGFNQAEIALIDQVVKCESLILILFSHTDNEAQIGTCQTVECGLPIGATTVNTLCEFYLLVG